MDSNNSPLTILSMSRLFLGSRGDNLALSTKDKEMAINIIGGKCSIRMKNERLGENSYKSIGKRKTPFSGLPTMVYIPCNSHINIVSETDCFDAMVYFAPSSLDNAPVVVRPEEVKVNCVGKHNWKREVRIGIADNIETQGLILGETINPPGNWSGYPPHKHDENKSPEYPQEEAYIFFFKPHQGFCLIRLYSSKINEPFDVCYTVKHNDAVAIPRGYHTIANAPGYELCYFFAMAGEEKHFGAVLVDPAHIWINEDF
jgi:5-deoxy-glucuronate isomerase